MQAYLKQIRILITPSWLSGLITALAGLLLTIGVIIISNFQGSSLQQQLFEVGAGQHTVSALHLQTVTDNLARNSVINNLPLFLFWAVLGVIVYMFVIAIWNSLSSAVQLHEKMEYVHANRQRLIGQAVQHTIFRLIVLGVWLLYLRLFLHLLLPYGLAAAHVAVHVALSSIGYLLLAFLVITAALHIHVVLLRLLLLRLRVVGGLDTDYTSTHGA